MRLVKFFFLILIVLIIPSTAFSITLGAKGWVGTWELNFRADGFKSGFNTKHQIKVWPNGWVRWLPQNQSMLNVKYTSNTLTFQRPVGRGWIEITLQRNGDTCQGKSIPVRTTGPKGIYIGKRISDKDSASGETGNGVDWAGTWELSATQADGSRMGGQLKMRVHPNGLVRLLHKDTRVKTRKLNGHLLDFQATGLSGGQIPYFSSPGESQGWTDVSLKRKGDTCQGSFKERKTGKTGTYRGRRVKTNTPEILIGFFQSNGRYRNCVVIRNNKVIKVKGGMELYPGDIIKTGKNDRVKLIISIVIDGEQHDLMDCWVEEYSELSINKKLAAFVIRLLKEMERDDEISREIGGENSWSHWFYELIRGTLKIVVHKIEIEKKKLFPKGDKKFIPVVTGKAGGGIRGTEFIVNTDPAIDTDTWIVLEGKVEVFSKQGQRLVVREQQLKVKMGGAFSRVKPIDWALVDRLGFGDSITRRRPPDTPKPPEPSEPSKGRIKRGWLGVEVLDISPKHKRMLGLKNQHGALVERTFTGGPADVAGIRAGDVIIAINEKTILDSRNMIGTVAASPPGTTLKVKIIHGRSIKNIRVKLGLAPEIRHP